MKTVWPDYDRSILSTLAALTGYFGVPLDYPPLKELSPFLATKPRHVMLLLLDGMGGYPLKTVLPETSYLRAHEVATVTSIFPPHHGGGDHGLLLRQAGAGERLAGLAPLHEGVRQRRHRLQAHGLLHRPRPRRPLPGGELIPYETVFERMQGVCGTHTLYAFDSYSE